MPESRKAIKVMVAEPSELLRAGLCGLIEEMPFCTLMAAIGAPSSIAALHLEANHHSVDVIIIGDATYQVAAGAQPDRFSAYQKRARLIVTLAKPEAFWSAIDAQADGYCLTEASSTVLACGIKVVADGGAFIGRDLARYLLHGDGWNRLTRLRPVGTRSTAFSSLSGREREILLMASEGKNNGQIALRLGLKPQTVKAHMNRVLKKLSVSDRTQAVIKALRSM